MPFVVTLFASEKKTLGPGLSIDLLVDGKVAATAVTDAGGRLSFDCEAAPEATLSLRLNDTNAGRPAPSAPRA